MTNTPSVSAAMPEPIRRAREMIDSADDVPPTLAELSREVGLSPSHLQRMFKRATGVSPKQYAEARRMERLKAGLRNGESVTNAMYDAGYGAPSRLYEQAALRLGMTPGTYARGGRGAAIGYAIADTALGRTLVAATRQGLCRVSFGETSGELVADLRAEYPEAEIAPAEDELAGPLAAVRAMIESGRAERLPLDIRATAFQAQVWAALRDIPPGETRTYAEIARQIGRPKGARAVGRACATNPVAVVIPCHRAVGSGGKLHGYRWGLARKQALLEREKQAGRGGGARL
jgi:AraC family transcriptional regulator of adaptative response/methylated-DNA-[protein]-cysteine methyltransferase